MPNLSGSQAFLFFLIELIVLFWLSKQVSKGISESLGRIFGLEGLLVKLMALMYLPGTIVHELSHFTMAKILWVKTGKVSLWPQRQGDSIRLGEVEIYCKDPFRRILIGIAPLLIGLYVLVLFLWFFPMQTWKQMVFAGYVVFVVANTMFSSKKDLEGLVVFIVTPPILLAVLLFFLNAKGVVIPYQTLMAWAFTPMVTEVLRKLCVLSLIPIGINTLVVVVCQLVRMR